MYTRYISDEDEATSENQNVGNSFSKLKLYPSRHFTI